MSAGGWHKVHTAIARRISANLGFAGRAVYDSICSYTDNDTGDTWVSPDTIAAEFGKTESYIRAILRGLRDMNAVYCMVRGNARFYRVNRTRPDMIVDLPKTAKTNRQTDNLFSETQPISGDIQPETQPVATPSIIELDSTSKPEITNPQILHTSSKGDFAADSRAPFLLDCIKAHFLRANGYELPPAYEFTLSGAVFDSLLNLPLPYWSNDKLADAVANFFASQRSKTQDPMSPPAKWVGGLYRYRDGPLDVYGKAMEFTDSQEAHGTAGIEIIGQTGTRLNAYQLRTANNLRAAAGAFRYFDRIEQAEGDRGGTDEAGRAHPREPG